MSEKSDKGGKPSLRLVDAKFPLPVEERKGEGKMQKVEGRLSGWAGTKRKFVCLDVIEYPGEHDDVVITFENAESKSRSCVPSAPLLMRDSTRPLCRSASGVSTSRTQVHCAEKDLRSST